MGTNIQTVLSHVNQLLVDIPSRRFSGLGEDGHAGLTEIAKGSQERCALMAAEQARIQADPLLSAEGRARGLAKLAQPAQALVDFLDQHLKTLTAARNVLHGRVYTAAPALSGSEAILAKMDAQEIRRAFAGKPRTEVDAAYLHALNNNQRGIAHALVSSPLGSMISPEVEARVTVEHAQQRDPAAFAQLTAKERLLEEVQALADHAAQATDNLKAYANG